MKIEFYNKDSGRCVDCPEDLMVDYQGKVFDYFYSEEYGWGYHRMISVDWRVAE